MAMVRGEGVLKAIAQDLVRKARENVTIDWTMKENVRAMFRRTLRKHGYPPDKTEKAVATVLQQAELVARDWAVARWRRFSAY